MNAVFQSAQRARQDDALGRIVPYSHSLTEEIVVTHAGDYVSTWLVQGLPFEGLSEAESVQHMNALNILVRSLSNGRFAFWVHRVRRAVGDHLGLPEQEFPRSMLERYYASMRRGGLMATQIYLTILYRPHPQRAMGLLGRPARTLDEFRAENAAAVDVMDNIHRQVASTLSPYKPALLGAFDVGRTRVSDQLSFYAYLLNGVWQPVPLKPIPLARYLPGVRLFFGNEMIEARDIHGSVFSTFIDIKDYADYSHPGILNTMLGLSCEYVETQSFSPMNLRDAQEALRRQRNQLISSDDNAQSQVEEMNHAMDDVISGNFSLGEYHYSMQVKAASIDKVKIARAEAIDALQAAGFLGVPLELITDHAFAAQLPGNWRSRPRVANLSSRNFCGLCAMHNFSTGKRTGNPWGEAVTILKSPAGQPVYFNFHATDTDRDAFDEKALGNTQIIGQSGGGKTVLALFLLMNLLKFGTQMVAFDKDRGMEIAIRAFGGKYLTLERGSPTGFAPFKMAPTPETLLFWAELVAFCARIPGKSLTAKEEDQIRHAVVAVGALPREVRSFAAVMQNLPNVEENSIAARLRKWCNDAENPGPFAWALDCGKDELEIGETQCHGFDYTELLEDDKTCPAIMMYLMHRVEQQIDGRRFAFFMDEYWKALSVEYFENFAKNKQKTIRKQNGFGVYMTQSPSDTLASPIARTLIEQTATFIFLPNQTADRDEYVQGFKLTETEYEVVKGLTPNSRLFAIKQGTRFSLASLDLHGFRDELKVLSGTTDNVARLDKLRARLGDDPSSWLEPFMKGEV